MSQKSFVWLCLLPLAVVTTAFFLLPMARLVVAGAEGPHGLAGYLAILTEGRYRATLINTVLLAAATTVTGFVPRAETGFQVKKPDMPPSGVRVMSAPAIIGARPVAAC